MKAHYYQEIQGWFDFQDEYRRAVSLASEGDTLIEVGCWRGQSLSFLLVEAANSGKRLNIVGVDHFRGSPGESYYVQAAAGGTIEEECRRHCDRSDYPYKILPVASSEAAAQFRDLTADFVFIDASHDYDSVCADLRAWLPKVKWDGHLAGHDYKGGWPGVAHAVHTYIPKAELLNNESSASWVWQKSVRQTGHWVRTPDAAADWLLYMGYVNRPDLLASALRSVEKHSARVVVIDQSDAAEACRLHRGPVFRWTMPNHFTAMQNWIQRDAQRRGLQRLLFMHSDAEAAEDGVELLLTKADQLFHKQAKERVGVIFSGYDALCVFNPEALAATGCWDESFEWYVSDIDYYNRLRWNGWRQHSVPEALKLHHVSQTLASLTDERREAVRQNREWSWRHYQHKWGRDSTGGDDRTWCCPYNNE